MKVTRYLSIAALMSLLLTVWADPASASGPDNQCDSPHCYDIGSQENSYSGVEGQWNDYNLEMPSAEVGAAYHMSDEMWLDIAGGTWVEEGLSHGCSKLPMYIGSGACDAVSGNDVYQQFWADDSANTGHFYFHHINTISSDNNNHSYEIWDSSNGSSDDYDVYVDFNKQGTSTDQNTAHGNEIDAGMELFSPGVNSGESANQNFSNAIERYINGDPGWQDISFDSHTSYDYQNAVGDNLVMNPCSTNPANKCFHWSTSSNGTSTWVDGKPTS